MPTIHKHVVAITAPITLVLPVGSKLLMAGPQQGVTRPDEVALWFEKPVVDDNGVKEFRYKVVGTGDTWHKDEVYRAMWLHAASWQATPYVWHLYELVRL